SDHARATAHSRLRPGHIERRQTMTVCVATIFVIDWLSDAPRLDWRYDMGQLPRGAEPIGLVSVADRRFQGLVPHPFSSDDIRALVSAIVADSAQWDVVPAVVVSL